MKPWPSVFFLIHRLSVRTAQFTAPISLADSANSLVELLDHRDLVRQQQLKPIQPIAFAPRTASERFSGVTSTLRYRASMPWWAYAALTIAPVGLPAAGVEKDPVSAGSKDMWAA